MAQRHRRRRHLLTLWGRKRQRILDEAAAREEAAHQQARARITNLTTSVLPMIPERRTPLLTRGQAARSSGTRS